MTKIDGIDPNQPIIQPKPADAGVKKDGPSFQSILDQATQQASATAKPEAAAQAADAMADIEGVKPPVAAQSLPPLQTEGVMRAERTLESLDRYTELLGNESKPLKEVFGALTAMEDEVKGLTEVLDSLDKGDPLFPVLQGVAVTAMTESIKFNRGDYNPA